jgi:glycerol dehydrogenase-like iron-containing ADH family enzyme
MSHSIPSTGLLTFPTLAIAPAQVMRGTQILQEVGPVLARYGQRPLIVGGERSLEILRPRLLPVVEQQGLVNAEISYGKDCSEKSLGRMRQAVTTHQADFIIGVGGGKALDAAKLLAHQCSLPIVTIPTTAATCAAWTALSNVYTEAGAFQYDVGLPHCPNLLLLDYEVIATAPTRTLIAGIGDALAKWYEASVSSGHSQQTLIIAIAQPGATVWQEVVDATVLMAGVIGGMGGAQCRTVAAHAVHNGLTHLSKVHSSLHGEKVAYGILVQLRLEELLQGSQLAASARQQLIKFYQTIGLPLTLKDLGLGSVSLDALEKATEVACAPESDIHRLPFAVTPVQLLAAMVSTTAPFELNSASKSFDTLTLESLSNRSGLNAPIVEELA